MNFTSLIVFNNQVDAVAMLSNGSVATGHVVLNGTTFEVYSPRIIIDPQIATNAGEAIMVSDPGIAEALVNLHNSHTQEMLVLGTRYDEQAAGFNEVTGLNIVRHD